MKLLSLLYLFLILPDTASAKVVGFFNKRYELDSNEVVVRQAEYAISSSSVSRGIVTLGIRNCIGISFYEARSKTGVLAHTDSVTDLNKGIEKMLTPFKVMQDIEVSSIEAVISGGWESWSNLRLSKILKELKRYGIHNIKLMKTLGSEAVFHFLDLETGKVTVEDDNFSYELVLPRDDLTNKRIMLQKHSLFLVE